MLPKLLLIPCEQQAALRDRLINEGMGYDAAVDWMREQFQVETSRTAMHRFYQEICQPILDQQSAVPSAPGAAQEAKPLVSVCISTAAATLRIEIMPEGAVVITKGEAT